ncbi:MAG: hypothetical protein JJU26_01360 [Oceanicaulis sp.]|uniref:hypothetical protein n=1 Tax=Glycocaulis sp. TaxID=1969725 RepID=UPI0025BA390D|nr:hypothetical protein [Glycocaulis sp.]MCC5980343.1 hypothetical protein [Oceanicaulis sp.]MCH8522513.1 hypothetical protein [Glycocaulis sp.]
MADISPCIKALAITGVFASTALAVSSAHSQEASPAIIEAIIACRSISEPDARLACLDEASGRLETAVRGDHIVVVEREQAVAAERDSFGLSFANPGRVLASIVGRATGITESGVQEYEDGVRAVRREDGEIDSLSNLPVRAITQNHRGQLIVTLQNGQVWRQIDNRRVRVPRSVDGVTLDVQRAALGSFFMSLSTSGVQVRAQRD